MLNAASPPARLTTSTAKRRRQQDPFLEPYFFGFFCHHPGKPLTHTKCSTRGGAWSRERATGRQSSNTIFFSPYGTVNRCFTDTNRRICQYGSLISMRPVNHRGLWNTQRPLAIFTPHLGRFLEKLNHSSTYFVGEHVVLCTVLGL